MSMPIPPRPSGFRLGAADAPVQVDAFVDVQCEYSLKAWPTLRALSEQCGPDRIAISAHLTLISHHRQSWDVSRAVMAVAGRDQGRFWDFMSFLYQRQEQYLNGAWRNRSAADLDALCTQFAAEFARGRGDDFDSDQFTERLASDEVFAATKVPLRYGIARGVWSTPSFFVNGSPAPALSSGSSVADWRAVIDPLLAA